MGMMTGDVAAKISGRHLAILNRAKEIDPEAFKGVKIPSFSDDQIARQATALNQATREVAEVKDFV